MTGATLLVTTGEHGIVFKKRHTGNWVFDWLVTNSAKLLATPPNAIAAEWQQAFPPDWADISHSAAAVGHVFHAPGARAKPTSEEEHDAFIEAFYASLPSGHPFECSYADYDLWLDLDRRLALRRKGDKLVFANSVKPQLPPGLYASPGLLRSLGFEDGPDGPFGR